MRSLVSVISLAVLVAGIGAFVAVWAAKSYVTDQLERIFTTASTRHISVRSPNGSITYEPYAGSDIRIEAIIRVTALTSDWAERLRRGVVVTFAHDGGRARAEVQERGGWTWFGNVEVDFVVQVPRDWMGEVALTTSNGPIKARHLRGDGSLRTSNSAIVVQGHTGELVARTFNGPIELTEINGTVQAHTSNDAIRIVDAKLSGNGRMRTSNESITFQGQLMEDATYEITTFDGNVTVVLAEPDVTLDMTTSNGRIDLQADVAVSRLDSDHVIGRIGAGTARLDVRTSDGTISLGVKP